MVHSRAMCTKSLLSLIHGILNKADISMLLCRILNRSKSVSLVVRRNHFVCSYSYTALFTIRFHCSFDGSYIVFIYVII